MTKVVIAVMMKRMVAAPQAVVLIATVVVQMIAVKDKRYNMLIGTVDNCVIGSKLFTFNINNINS